MTNKMPKPAYQILLGVLILTFTVIACNNKKEEKKDVIVTDTVKPLIDTLNMDSATTRPVKVPD